MGWRKKRRGEAHRSEKRQTSCGFFADSVNWLKTVVANWLKESLQWDRWEELSQSGFLLQSEYYNKRSEISC